MVLTSDTALVKLPLKSYSTQLEQHFPAEQVPFPAMVLQLKGGEVP